MEKQVILSCIINHLKTKIMNTTLLKGNWNVIKGKLRQKYADLTDDDLQYLEGKEEEMLGKLQKKLGKSREEVEDEISEL